MNLLRIKNEDYIKNHFFYIYGIVLKDDKNQSDK